MGDRERRIAGVKRATVGKMGDRERRFAGAERATVGKMGDKERRIAGAERATVGKGARMPEKLNIFVTYNGIKNLISCQKGTSFLKFHDQVQKAFSATGERFTFKEIGGMTDDYVNDQNWEKRLKDAMKLLAIGGKQQTPRMVNIHVTYNDTKRIISYQKGGDVQGLISEILRRFSDVSPAKVASEPFKLLRYDERFKDYAELENEFKFDDDHKVTVLIKEVQVKEKEGRTPLHMSISEDQHKITARNSEPATLSNGFLRDLTEERISYFKFHGLTAKEKEGGISPRMLREGSHHIQLMKARETPASSSELVGLPHFQLGNITDGSTFRFWSAVSNKNGGVMKRSTSENKVICDGTFEPDDSKDTHIQVSDVGEKQVDENSAMAFLFTDTNGQYAMKGVELGQEIQTELTSSPLDINCLFEPAYYWGFTMLKHVKTGYYVGCDYTGKTTLVKNSMPNYPNPEILFIVNAPDLI